MQKGQTAKVSAAEAEAIGGSIVADGTAHEQHMAK